MNYNYIAPYYDVLSRMAFCNRQQMAHKVILKHLHAKDKWLWIGGGSGWFLKEIDALNLPLEIDYIEFSEVMINRAKKIPLHHIKVNFIHADAFNYTYAKAYDGIITAFFFDHFKEEQCQSLFKRLDQHLKPNGLWFYVDFIQNQNLVQQLLTQSMILFFRWVANIKTTNFPKIEALFHPYECLEVQYFFGRYITSRIYKK